MRKVHRARRAELLKTAMDPSLWGRLPADIVHLVFSYLPVAEICKLRGLSKAWKQDIDSPDSEFGQLLEKTTYPRMFGVISLQSEGQYRGMVVDVKSSQEQAHACAPCKGHGLPVEPSENYVAAMGASDGGLVCFVSRGTMSRRFIVVMNPLTGKKTELPGLDSRILPLMVQLTMDRQTWKYKVLLVGQLDGNSSECMIVQTYDSSVKGWTVVGSQQQAWDRIYGYAFRMWIFKERRLTHLALLGPCMYDFTERTGFHYFRQDGQYAPYPPPHCGPQLRFYPNARNIACAVLKNHLFVLTVPEGGFRPDNPFHDFYISENVFAEDLYTWQEVNRITCVPFHAWTGVLLKPVHSILLDACKGFLTLILDRKVGYLYDLSRCFWLDLPPMPPRTSIRTDTGPVDFTCELRWNAVP